MVLPIKQKDVYAGLAQISGLLRVENEQIVVEYKVQDEVLGVFHSEVKSIILPFRSIDSVEVKKRWFTTYFNLYLNHLPKTDKPLILKENCLQFAIKKSHREKAESIRSKLMLELTEQKLRDLDEYDEGITDSPAGNLSDPDGVEVIKKTSQEENRVLKNILKEKNPD